MHMIQHEMLFLDLALLLVGRSPEHIAEIPAYMPKQGFASILWDEHDMVLTLPAGVT